MHMVVPGKFLAFRGPCDKDCRGSLRPSDLVQVFKTLAVAVIVRLNEAEYDNTTFLEAGFEHTDLIFQVFAFVLVLVFVGNTCTI